MTLYGILDNLMYFIGTAVITVILLYWIYIENIKKRLLNITEKIIMIVCILLAHVINKMMIHTMTLYEIILDHSFIFIAIIAVIVLYWIYIEDIKKRPLNKTEKIIGAICILLVFTIIVINMMINIMMIQLR